MLTDHDLQAKLAEAFHQRADPVTVNAIDAAGIFRRGVRRRRRRIAAGVASVVAAALLVPGVWVASAGAPPAAPGPGFRPPGLLLEAAVVRPPHARAAEVGMPPAYVIADDGRPVAKVRSSKTGKILDTVPLPIGIDPKLSRIAAVGDGRTFVLALSFPQTRFYLLRVAARGHSSRLTSLPVPPLPAGQYASAIAVSPGGGKLAVAVQLSGGRRGAVEVATLATGAVRRWSSARPGQPTQLSWAGNGHELGFFWEAGGSAQRSAAGLWVLDTTAPGQTLVSARRILPAHVDGDTVQSALLSHDGATVVASVTYDGTAHLGPGVVAGGIVELSARTGRPLRTLLAEHAAHAPDRAHPGWYVTTCQLTAVDATGRHLLVSCDSFGRLDRARFTALPGAAPQAAVAAAW